MKKYTIGLTSLLLALSLSVAPARADDGGNFDYDSGSRPGQNSVTNHKVYAKIKKYPQGNAGVKQAVKEMNKNIKVNKRTTDYYTKICSGALNRAVKRGPEKVAHVIAWSQGTGRSKGHRISARVWDQGFRDAFDAAYKSYRGSIRSTVLPGIKATHEEAVSSFGSKNGVKSANLVCIARNAGELDETTYKEFVNTRTKQEKGGYSKKGAISFVADVTAPLAGSQDPFKKNFENQPAKILRTEFGKVVAKHKSGGYKNTNELKKAVEDALKKDKNLSLSGVLSPKNREALSEGGYLNLTRRGREATIKMDSKKTWVEEQTCKQKYLNGKAVGSPSCGKWKKKAGSENVDYNTLEKDRVKMSTQEVSDFSQIIGVQCNLTGAKETEAYLRKAGRLGTKRADNVRNGGFYTLMTTKPSKDATDLFKGRLESRKSFYTLPCSPGPVPETGDTPSAQCVADEVKNKKDWELNNKELKMLNEAGVITRSAANKGKKEYSNGLDIFRGGSGSEVEVSLVPWKPVVDSDVKLGVAGKSTQVVRDVNGTPQTAKDDRGVFTMLDSKGNAVFDRLDHNPPETGQDLTSELPKAGSSFEKFNSVLKKQGRESVSRVIPGTETDFVVYSTWASKKDRPNKIAVIWHYSMSGTHKTEPKTIDLGVFGKVTIPGSTVSVSGNYSCTPVFNGIGGSGEKLGAHKSQNKGNLIISSHRSTKD